MMGNRQHRRRAAFTLVEMLVSTALIIFVLVILSSVFTTGIGALRTLRGVGIMQDHLRYATSTLRNDLAAPHFGRETDGVRGPSLSQQRLDLYDWSPPKEGFFRITQLPEPNATGQMSMGTFDDIDSNGIMDADGDGMTSTTATRHSMHFTVRVEPNAATGSGRDQLFATSWLSPSLMSNTKLVFPNYPQTTQPALLDPFRLRFSQHSNHMHEPTWDLVADAIKNQNPNLPGPPIYSPWAEIAYFVRPNGQQAGNAPLYTLYRRRRVIPDIRSAYVVPNNRTPFQPTSPQPLPATDADLMVPASGGFAGNNLPTVVKLSDVSVYDAKPPGFANNAAPLFLNTPANINVPFRRFGMDPVNANTQPKVLAMAGLYETRPLAGAALPPMPTGHYKSMFEDLDPKVTAANTASSKPGGDDILLENVLSFEIKVNWDVPTDSRININQANLQPKVFPPTQFTNNPDYPFDYLPESPQGFGNDTLKSMANTANNPEGVMARVFDTWRGEDYVAPAVNPPLTVPYSQWNSDYCSLTPKAATSPVSIPLRIRVKAIQVRIRIWDAKTKQTRQVTIVQDV